MSENEQQVAEETTQEQAPSISLQDIDMARRVIALASRRGAFEAGEMSAVGGLFDKLNAFLKANAPEEAAAEEGEAKDAETKPE